MLPLLSGNQYAVIKTQQLHYESKFVEHFPSPDVKLR